MDHLALCVIIFLIINVPSGLSLDNGLALTPPMGWMSWERFRCTTDCKKYPNECLNEQLFMQIADRLVDDGYLKAGYQYLIIDDCWADKKRDSVTGDLVPDPERFPRGMKFVSDYIHGKGLKFGLYTNYGPYTCMLYPGTSDEYIERDMKLFASWNVDYIKVDGCHSSRSEQKRGYVNIGKAINATGRPMVYSCSWPYYDLVEFVEPDYSTLKKTCNMWRNYHDMKDSFAMVEFVLNYFGDYQEILVPHAGPGHWNDPDMLMIGIGGLTASQSRAQMALWAILAAPLLMSNDLRTIKAADRSILQDREVIEIDQDPLGIQGKRVYKENGVTIWVRPISPTYSPGGVGSSSSTNQSYYSYAVAMLNHHYNTGVRVSINLTDYGINHEDGYRVRDVYARKDLDTLFYPSSELQATIRPTDVKLFKLTLVAAAAARDNSKRLGSL